MRIRTVRVEGFRSLRDLEVRFAPLTFLIGPNGSGKSSFLGALRSFFEPQAIVDEGDFWMAADSIAEEISISVTFEDMNDEQRQLFSTYISAEGNLTVSKLFTDAGKGRYLARRQAIREFVEIRRAPRTHRDQFNALVTSGNYPGLVRASKKEEAFRMMEEYERQHPERCESMDDDFQFFGYREVGAASISSQVRPLFVGALDDPASQVRAGGAGALRSLLELIGGFDEMEQRLSAVAADSGERVRQVLDESSDRLREAETLISAATSVFAPGIRVELSWQDVVDFQAPMPIVIPRFVGEDRVSTDLAHQGHGVQRAVLLGLLTALADRGADVPSARTLLIAIEEPEIFQHPLSSRRLARVLSELAERDYQIVYSTHSPLFVQPRWLDGLRAFSREEATLGGLETRAQHLDLLQLAVDHEAAVQGRGFTRESIRARLQSVLDPAKLEGLFARVVVLVEGQEETGLLQGAAVLAGADLDQLGVAIVEADGKSNIPLLCSLFAASSVAVYPVFDLDRESEDQSDRWAEDGVRRILGLETSRALESTLVEAEFACFRTNMGDEIRGDLGLRYDEVIHEVCLELGYPVSQGKKNVEVLRKSVVKCGGENVRSQLLARTLEAILAKLEG